MFENTSNMVMPVSPMNAYGGNNGFGNCYGGDGMWWIVFFFLLACNNNWNNGGNGGGYGMPYMIGNNTNADLQRGFDQQAVMSGVNSISTNLCNGFAGVNQSLTSGFANAEIANNARQIADMQQAFASQTAMTAGLNNLQSQLAQCCCDNRLATANLNSTILSEDCATRATFSDGVRDILVNQTNNTQRLVDTTNSAVQGIYDKICQLELNAKDEKISDLTAQLAQARSDASTLSSIQTILADNLRQTQTLEQRLNPNPIPAYIVANPNCCNQTYGVYQNQGCCAS